MGSALRSTGTLQVGEPGEAPESLIGAGRADTARTLQEIGTVYRRHGYLLDPHTAVGVAVAREWMAEEEPMLCLATAHPAKFGPAILDATGEDLAHHPELDRLAGLPVRRSVIDASDTAVRDFIAAHATKEGV